MVYHTHSVNKTRSACSIGQQAEQLACDYLQANGLKLITRNFRKKGGEIDLIMQDADYIVFVEVRYRQTTDYGGALASIDTRKQQRLISTAEYYLQHHAPHHNARFDVVTLEGTEDPLWIQNALTAG